MLSPKGFGPRADSGLPSAGQTNDGYNENAWMMMMIGTFYADLLYIFLGFKTKYIQKEKKPIILEVVKLKWSLLFFWVEFYCCLLYRQDSDQKFL